MMQKASKKKTPAASRFVVLSTALALALSLALTVAMALALAVTQCLPLALCSGFGSASCYGSGSGLASGFEYPLRKYSPLDPPKPDDFYAYLHKEVIASGSGPSSVSDSGPSSASVSASASVCGSRSGCNIGFEYPLRKYPPP